MKDYKHIEHLRNLNNSLIWERLKYCYDYGYEDGQKEKPQAIYEMKVEEYNKGLNEAWECARKMCLMSSEERLRAFDVSGNHLAILSDLTAPKAIAKLKAYEERQKEIEDIKVGYEVYNVDRENKRIVTAIDGNKAIQLCSNGKYTIDNIDTLHWTGREDLRIKKVLGGLSERNIPKA